MSQLDKEAVLDEFTAAYKASHGKAPKVEASNGWYSVDGGKNMRLAQIHEWADELNDGSKKAADKKTEAPAKTSNSQPSKTAKKPAKKSSTNGKKSAKKSASGGTAAESWKAYLQSLSGQSRLPRGMQ